MEAVVAHEYGEAQIEDVPRPTPEPEEVLVEVSRVQLSVTDAWTYRGDLDRFASDAMTERIESGEGQIFGHEFAGTVVELGTAVDEFAIGDRVYPPGKISCGACEYCERGYKAYCTNKGTVGFDRPGALAEFVSVPTEVLCRLPASVSDAEGAALQPAAAALVCVHDAGVTTGDVVVTVGLGVMGMAAAQFAASHGAETVIASDVVAEKLSIAADHGITTIDARTDNPVEQVERLTGGIGADVVFEAVGGEQDHGTTGSDPLAQAMQLVRRAGTVVQIGIMPSELAIDPWLLRGKYVTWVNPRDPVGVLTTGPASDTGETAATMIADGRVSIEEYIPDWQADFGDFDEVVDATLNKADYGFLGPPQITP